MKSRDKARKVPAYGAWLNALGAVAACALIGGCSQHQGPAKGDAGAQVSAPKSAEPEGTASLERQRLITGQQYLNTIEHVFGADIAVISPFAPLRRTDGLLASGAASAGVPSSELQQFQRAAASIAAQVIDAGNLDLRLPAHRDTLIPCRPADEKKADSICAAQFLRTSGRLLYRQPLSDEKLAELVSKAGETANQLGDFYRGLGVVLEGMLISPNFLFVRDDTVPDPARPGFRKLDGYSLAARLSFFLWDAAPDDLLLKSAASGELDTDSGRRRVVDRMLASPRLEAGVRAFFDDMFAFDDFDNLAKDAATYPSETGATLTDAREQTLRTIFSELVVKGKDYRDLYTTRSTFMSPTLAAIYRVPTTPGWQPYEFAEGSPRVGILTHISFLAVHAHPARSSATRRGKALRELLLCQPVPPPPPNVDFSIVEDPKATFRTARERLTAHRSNPACAGCHKITDPMGLALENFDGAGQFRDSEKGAAIDASGVLDGKEFKDVAGLAAALHDHPSLPTCLVKRVYSYATGGPLTSDDQRMLDYLAGRFAIHGYKLPDLLRTIALSRGFSEIREEKEAASASADVRIEPRASIEK